MSDTTGDAMKYHCSVQKKFPHNPENPTNHGSDYILLIEPLHINPTKKMKYKIPKNIAV